MPQTPATRPDVVIGDPYSQSFQVTVNNSPILNSTVVKAAIVNIDKDTNFTGVVTCTVSSDTWTPSFTGTQTKQMLTTPTDLTSKISSKLTKYKDEETGYATALLEVQVGSPYNLTWHSRITVDKGLID